MKWENHPKIELELSNLYDKYGSNYNHIISELSDKFEDKDFSYNSVRNRIRRSPIIEYIPHKRGQGLFDNLTDNSLLNDYTEAKEKIKETIKYFNEKYGDKEIKILSISDLHIPKEDLDVLEQIILENQDCDVLIIAGDLLDYDNLSRFGQKKNIDVRKEFQRAVDILKKITPMFEDVFIINGNHEKRWVSYIERKTVNALTGYLTNKMKPLSQIVQYFDNVTYVPHWFCQLGDVVFAHPSRYSKIKGRTVRNVVNNRLKKDHETKFEPFSTVVIGHTHDIFKGKFKNKIAVETGCVEQKDVEFANSDARGKNWTHAFTRINMKQGKTNWNNVDVNEVA